MSSSVLTKTAVFGRAPTYTGKVRETYDVGDERLLMVATDRISALDVVLPNGVPDKGRVLTQLSEWWFWQMKEWGIPHHFVATVTARNDVDMLGRRLPQDYYGRSMVVRKASRLDCEAIVRGYITGSGWKDYQATGAICGIRLPKGLLESEEFVEPLFTPSTKAEVGHDQNISFQELMTIIGHEHAEAVRDLSYRIYKMARQVARERGIIIADTKFEFGVINDRVILIDEVLTPDSSRFWPLAGYEAGHGQPSFDKQPVRDWLSGERAAGRWDGTQENAPVMPEQLVKETSERYHQIYRLLTGSELKVD